MTLFCSEESFSTVCGIDDGCSEVFYENFGKYVVDFGREDKTTCKHCLARYKKMLDQHDQEVSMFVEKPTVKPEVIDVNADLETGIRRGFDGYDSSKLIKKY